MAKKFKVNRAGIRQLAGRSQSGQAMEQIAQKIASRAQANGGRFTQGYGTKQIKIDGTAGARAGTDYSFAHWDEWGSRYRAARAPLRRALSSLGLLTKTKVRGRP